MNKTALLLLGCCSSGLYAESMTLPPVIDHSTYINQRNIQTAPSNGVLYETLGRIEQLQNEVQQLRGLVEEQSQQITQLKKRQTNIYSDLDSRIQTLDDMYENDVHKKHPTDVNITPTYDKPLAQIKETPVEQPKIVNIEIEKATYQAAYNRLKNGHNARAISAFNDFLIKYPNSDYADNSQYWLGEAYKVNQDLEASKAAFKKVINQYKNSPKISDSLLKLGYIALEQNNRIKAIDYLKQVQVNHPQTTAAHLASKKLVQIGAIQP